MHRSGDRVGEAPRQRGTLRRVVLLGATAAWLPSPAIAAPEVAGYVQQVRGEVTAELAEQRRVLVPRGDIFLGDDVESAARSRAALQLGRDTTLRLGANARVRIDRFIANAGGVLTVEAGPLMLDKAPGSGGTLYIRGQFGLIAVRGTRVWVGPSKGVIGVFVVHGLVDVTSGGKSVRLQTHEGTDLAAPGAPPTLPAVWGKDRVSAAIASVS